MVLNVPTGTALIRGEERPLHLTFRVQQPRERQTPLTIMTEFGEILIKYGDEQDDLSRSLMDAGHTFMVYVYENRDQSFEVLLRGAIERIEGIKKVLKNPFGPSLFKEPMLVEGIVVWDRSSVDEYNAYAHQFSGRAVEAVPHRLGREVLEWIGRLPIEANEPEVLAQGVIQAAGQPLVLPQAVVDYQRYLQYGHLIDQSKRLKESQALIRRLESVSRALEEANVLGFQRFEQDLARQEESQLQQTAELQRGLRDLQTQYRGTVAMEREARNEAQATTGKLQAHLEAAYKQMASQREQIGNLCAQLQGCQAQLGHLQNELNNKDDCSVM